MQPRFQRLGVVMLGLALCTAARATEPIVVGSKNFEESRLLAEIFAQLLEERAALDVERRFNLAGTQVCFEALRTGALDLYPEYTGTGLRSILGEERSSGRRETLTRVRREFLERWDLWWLGPLGFENAYALAVPEELAEREGLRTISDLVRVAPQLRAGFGYEFVERPDGLPGLRERYGLRFDEVVTLQQTLKYQAVRSGRVDVLDVYTTDGRLRVYDLRVLEDDREFFPPYEAAPLVRGATLRVHPEVGTVLALLAGALDEAFMRDLNYQLQESKRPVTEVARRALERLGLVAETEGAPQAGGTGSGSVAAYLWSRRHALARRTLEHLALSGFALALGALVAIPLGLVLERAQVLAEHTIRSAGLLQTVPSLALLAVMVPLLGVGVVPALAALWVYSLYPMLRNTYTGVRGADPAAVEAATASGMTPGQVLRYIRLPLAVPVILAGVRTSAVLLVGTATLAAFIGAGGLGVPIIAGLQMADTPRILSGALPAALLAWFVDGALAWLQHRLHPRGVG